VRRTYLVVLLLAGIFLSAFVLPVASPGVITFEKTYGEDIDCYFGRAVQQTSDGGYVVAGFWQYGLFGDIGPLLFKTDSLGNRRWWQAIKPLFDNVANSVQQTFDGGYIVGTMFGMTKTDAVGREVWTRGYGSSVRSVRQTSGGGYIAAGGYLLMTDAVGNLLWARDYGDIGFSVLQTWDEGYVMAGYKDDQVYLVKADHHGDSLWARTYGTGTGYSVWETLDSGYVIGGVTGEDMYLVKTNSLGESLWTRTYGGTGRDYAYSVQQTSDGGYILAGRTDSFTPGYRAYLVKTDSLGYILWTRLYGGSSWTDGFCAQQTSDGGYVIVGDKDCGAYLIKTDEEGGLRTDAGVVTLDAPGDTVLSDSICAVVATVRNFGVTSVTFDVIARIDSLSSDGYEDTVQVEDLPPDSSVEVVFKDWHVPPTDSTIYEMVVCTAVPQDWDTSNDCRSKSIFAYHVTYRDAGVVSVDSPGDTVFIDSLYPVIATVQNFGNIAIDFDVVAFIDGYDDRISVEGLAVGSTIQVTFRDWQVPLADSTTYRMAICTVLPHDSDTSNDCSYKSIFAYNLIGMQEGVKHGLQAADYRLEQNDPNPLRGSTVMGYSLPAAVPVSLKVYDMAGRLIEILVDENQESGTYRIRWQAKDRPAGIYFYRLQAGNFVDMKKMTVVH